MKEVERMEMMKMEREASNKEWEASEKAWETSDEAMEELLDERSEAEKVVRDRTRAECEASWEGIESTMCVISPGWNKMKTGRRQFWDKLDEIYHMGWHVG